MKYSIITPVYNREDCIARCIESVLYQKNINELDGEFEHIIINDGSNDLTDAICKKYAKENSLIKYISFPENKGTNAARNAGIKIASGTFCIILDSDDYFVDNALQIINNIISKSTYNYYMFCSDDMIENYNQNQSLQTYQKELSFQDFLLNKVGGDFIHVMPRQIIQQLPFDESLRIYEGVFFLRFYKQVKKMLFTKEVVTIRERSRKDSVTREVFRTNKNSIRKSIIATELSIEWFYNDYISYKAKDVLLNKYTELAENYILLSDYKKAQINIKKIYSLGNSLPIKIILIYKLRLGYLYRISLKLYLLIKYSLLNKKLK